MRLKVSILSTLLLLLSGFGSAVFAQTWYVAGDFTTPPWGDGQVMMNDNGDGGDVVAADGIYSLEYTIASANEADSYYEFKVNDGGDDWHPPNNVRLNLDLDNTDVLFTFDTNSYSDGWVPDTNIVHSSHVLSPANGGHTWVAVGDFQASSFDPTTGLELSDTDGDGVYEASTTLDSGDYMMKFTADYAWDVHQFGNNGWGIDNAANIPFSVASDGATVDFKLDTNTGRAWVGEVVEQTAMLQLVHNSADPAVSVVDIYVDGAIFEDDFEFRDATTFYEVPAGEIDVAVAPGNSSSADDAIYTATVTLDAGMNYVAMAHGVLDPSGFSPNPAGADISFDLDFSVGFQTEASDDQMVDLIPFHGTTDAPPLAILDKSGNTILPMVAYGSYADYLTFTPDAHTLGLAIAGTTDLLFTYTVNVTNDAGRSGILFASGFGDPSLNQGGAWGHIFIAWADGSVGQAIRHITPDITNYIDNNCLSMAQGLDVLMRGKVTVTDQFGSNGPGYFQMDSDTGSRSHRGGLAMFGISDYNLAIGDSIEIIGRLSHFNGLQQISPIYNIEMHSTGNTVVPLSATLADIFAGGVDSEDYEGVLVELNGLTLVDPSQWPDAGSNANVDVMDADGNTGVIRIDRDTDIDETAAPADTFSLVGVVGQFDNNGDDGYCDGYQILPRMASDITSESDGCVDNNEPNDTADVATMVSLPSATPACIDPEGDVDWYAFDGTAGTPVRIYTERSDAEPHIDPELYFYYYDAAGDSLVYIADNDDLNGNLQPLLEVNLTMDATYYVRLAHYANGPSRATTGAYTFYLEDQPVYSICDLSMSDENCVPVLLGEEVTVEGIMTATDHFGASGPGHFQFDGCGFSIFSGDVNLADLLVGDHVSITGTVDEYNGLGEIVDVTNIEVLSNVGAPAPTSFNDLSEIDEEEEGLLVTVNGVTLVDPENWPEPGAGGSGSNVMVEDTFGNTMTLRVDHDTNVWDVAAPTGLFNVTAIVGQFDGTFSDPGDCDGYQLLPRMADDIDGFSADADFLVWAPQNADGTSDSSSTYIAAALEANGYSAYVTDDLFAANPLDAYMGLFVTLGIYSNNAEIAEDGPEGPAIENYLNGGGSAYIEGGDFWAWDPTHGGYNLNPAFGIEGTSDGGSDLETVNGVPGTFTEGFTSAYTGENNWIDHIQPAADANSWMIFVNPADDEGCGVVHYNEEMDYRTIGTAFQFSGLEAGLQTSLMADMLDFMVGDDDSPVLCPPQELSATTSTDGIELNWTTTDDCLSTWMFWHHDFTYSWGGVTDGGAFEGATKYDATDLAPYVGWHLTHVNFVARHADDPDREYYLKVWKDGMTENDVIYREMVPAEELGEPGDGDGSSRWITHELLSPILIEEDAEYSWGVEVHYGAYNNGNDQGYFILALDGGPLEPGKGGWERSLGSDWRELNDDVIPGGVNWMHEGYVTPFAEVGTATVTGIDRAQPVKVLSQSERQATTGRTANAQKSTTVSKRSTQLQMVSRTERNDAHQTYVGNPASSTRETAQILEGFEVWRSEDDGASYDQIATIDDPSTMTYLDTDVTPGQDYCYVATAVYDEGTSEPSEAACALAIETDVDYIVWNPNGDTSGDAIAASIAANGWTVFMTPELMPYINANLLANYSGIFVCLGMSGDDAHYVIGANDPEGPALQQYLVADGGNLYVEGGDTYTWDVQENNGFNFNNLLGVNATSDGGASPDIDLIEGVADFASGISSDYSGPDAWVDHIDPISPSVDNFRVFTNTNDGEGCGVAYTLRNPSTGDAVYNSLALSFRFGGLEPSLHNNLMAGMIGFMTSGTDVEDPEMANIPRHYKLDFNYPNPFNPSTTIQFALPQAGQVSMEVYNAAGQRVRTLIDREMEADYHTVRWDGRNDAGTEVSSGVYFYRLKSENFDDTKRMMLLK